jgi:hypothetical protein
MSTPATDPLPGLQPIASEPIQFPNAARARIYSRLPKMWIGMVIATLCLLCQVAIPGYVFTLLLSMVGSCYWLFCVHRIHKVLAEYTGCRYPISPFKAVGFQFIPVFEYFWFFRWTRRLATFIEAESGKPQMSKVWPGMLLTTASVLGWFGAFKSVRLFLIFGFGTYLTRKLKVILPACRPFALKRWHQWNLSMSAGVGAAFSFVLFQAGQHFFGEQPKEKLHELAAIFLVSVAMLIFLEPVFERLRIFLGIAENHPALRTRKPFLLRLAVLLILLLTSLLHGLLHSEIESAINTDLMATLSMLFTALLVSGGITYFWIGASHLHPPHAARSGLVSGAVLGFLVAFTVLMVVSPEPEKTASAQANMGQQVIQYAFPFVPSRIVQDVAKGDLANDSGLEQMGMITLPWALLGLAGGFAIDRRWLRGRALGVALSLFSVALLAGLALWLARRVSSGGEMLWHLSAVIGWGLALIVCSSSRILMPEEQVELPASS